MLFSYLYNLYDAKLSKLAFVTFYQPLSLEKRLATDCSQYLTQLTICNRKNLQNTNDGELIKSFLEKDITAFVSMFPLCLIALAILV